MTKTPQLVAWFDDLGRDDVARVGGKNASLGEMIRQLGGRGVHVPPGFATTADDPIRWRSMMKQAIGNIAYYFNSQRMMRRYASEAYLR